MADRSMQIGRVLVPDFTAPRPCDVDLAFMEYRLARIVRFSGHPQALTVAEHQALTAHLAWLAEEPTAVHRWAAYHDAHEYALGDTPTPLKRLIGDTMLLLEDAWDAAVAGALSIPAPTPLIHEAVRTYDLLALRVEWEWCLGLDPAVLDLPDGPPAMAVSETDAHELFSTVLGPPRAREIAARRAAGMDAAVMGALTWR